MTGSIRMLAVAAALATLGALGAGAAHADQAATLYHKAMAYKQAGKIDDAVKTLKEAISEREDYAAAHFSLGILYRQKKNDNLAIYHLERATKLDSKAAQAFYSLGLAYHQAGCTEEAMKALAQAAALAPKDDQIQSGLGTLLIRKEPKRAIPYLLAAVRAQPRNAAYLHSLGLAYRKASDPVGEGKPDPKVLSKEREVNYKLAEEYLIKSADLKEDATTSFDLGVLFRRMGKTEKAIARYEEAVRLDPKFAAAYWDLGWLYQQAKREDEAIASYESYLKLQGRSQDAGIARKRIQELRAAKKK